MRLARCARLYDRRFSVAGRGLAAAVLLLGVAAGAQGDPPPDSGQPAAERPRIGLVLGGGGARGGAHVGVLSVLEELRIPVDCIAGTSMGALVGATYATGKPLARIEEEILNVNWSAIIGSEGQRSLLPMQRKLAGITYSNSIEFNVTSSGLQAAGGLVSTQNIEGFFRQMIGDARYTVDFDELAIPFRAVATDLAASEMVVIGGGDLTRAMRASMAVPGVFSPVIEGDQVLADGGMMRNLPVDVARELCADVVIAVSLEAPPPQPEQLRSMFALAGRSIDAMIIANERQQLASLTETDVAIIVPTEDLGSGQFDRVPETIPLGVGAARAAAASLGRYSLPEDEYRQWRAGLDRAEPPVIHVEAIRFTPLRHASEEFLATRLRIRPGDSVTLAALEHDLRRVYAAGDFERVDYHLYPGPNGGAIVEIQPIEPPGSTNFVRFDLGLAGSSGGDTQFVLRSDHRREWVNPLGGQWRNALQLGTLSELETAFYQPLDVPQRFYVEPGFLLRRTIEDVYDDGSRVARYELTEAETRVDVGVNFGNHARVRTGLRWGTTEYDEDIGSIPGVDLERRRDANVNIGAVYDTRNAATLPTSGIYAQLDFTSSGSWLGGEQSYDVFEAVGARATRWRDGTLLLAAGAGRRVGGELPRHRDFQIGGIRSFPAFAPGELRGEKYWAVTADWAKRLVDIAPLFRQVMFGGFGLGATRVTDRLDGVNDGIILGASVIIGARTPLGPLMFSAGAADNGSVTVHFALGRPIPEGSLLDRLH